MEIRFKGKCHICKSTISLDIEWNLDSHIKRCKERRRKKPFATDKCADIKKWVKYFDTTDPFEAKCKLCGLLNVRTIRFTDISLQLINHLKIHHFQVPVLQFEINAQSTSDNIRNWRNIVPDHYPNLGGFKCIKCNEVLSKKYAGCDAAVSQESISPVGLPEFFYSHTHGTDDAAIPVDWLLKFCIKENAPHQMLPNIKCKYCHSVIIYAYNLTDMWHHLVNEHEGHPIMTLCDRPITDEAGPSGNC